MLTLLILLGTARAQLPAAFEPLPPARSVDVVSVPGETRLFLGGDAAGLVLLRRTSDRPSAEGPAPTCTGGGVDVFAPDFAGDPWLSEACARLERLPPPIAPGPRYLPGTTPDERQVAESGRFDLRGAPDGLRLWPALLDDRGRLHAASWPWRWLHPVALAWTLLLAAALPRNGAAWLLASFALGVRIAFTPDRILMSGDQPYMAYVTATGLDLGAQSPSPTWTALLGPAWLLAGRPLDLPHTANLGFSVLTVLALWDLVRRWYGDRAAFAAAFLLATLPLHVATSRSESLFTLAALLQVTALLGAERPQPWGPWLSATSLALLAHLHPVLVLPAGVLTAWIAWRTGLIVAPGAAGVMVAGAAGRLVGWLRTDDEVWQRMDLARLDVWAHPTLLTGPGGTLSLSNPWVTPLGATALALLAAIRMPRGERRYLAVAAAAAALSTLPFLHLPLPTDVARFQLPGQVWIAAMAGAGWALLDRRAVRVWAAALAISWFAARQPLGGRRWTWTAEHDALTQALPFVPSLQIVRYRPADQGTRWQQRWLQLHQRGVWRPLVDDPLAPGQLRWLGRADRGAPPDGCALLPILTERIDLHDAHAAEPGDDRVVVGMFEVITCGDPPAPDPLEPVASTWSDTTPAVRPQEAPPRRAPAPAEAPP